MKTKILIFTVIASIIFTACKKDDDDKPAETTPTEQATLFNKKWVQQKWYLDPDDMINTVQTWEFLNDSVMKRTVSFPNTTEYQTYTIYDKWSYITITYDSKHIKIETDSLFYLTNSGTESAYGSFIYEQQSLTNNELILESLSASEKYTFKAE